MAKQSATEKLKESIRLLDAKQAVEGRIFREQVNITCEKLKPSHLIVSTINDLTGASGFKGSLLETAASLLSGYMIKKMLVKQKSGFWINIFGDVLRYGLAGLVSRKADSFGNIILNLVSQIIKTSEKKSE